MRPLVAIRRVRCSAGLAYGARRSPSHEAVGALRLPTSRNSTRGGLGRNRLKNRRRARASGCGRARRGIRPRRAGGQSRPSRDANRGRVVGVLKPNSRHVDTKSRIPTRAVCGGARRAPPGGGRRRQPARPFVNVEGYTLLGPPPLLARLTPAPVSMVAVDGSPLTRSAEVRSSRSGGGSPLPRKPPPPVGEASAHKIDPFGLG